MAFSYFLPFLIILFTCCLLQIIAKAIRDLLQIAEIPWNRSIQLPPREQLGKNVVANRILKLSTYHRHRRHRCDDTVASCRCRRGALGIMLFANCYYGNANVRYLATRTTTRSCRDPETAVSNFWSLGGVRGRPQRVLSDGSGRRRLLLVPRRRRCRCGCCSCCCI